MTTKTLEPIYQALTAAVADWLAAGDRHASEDAIADLAIALNARIRCRELLKVIAERRAQSDGAGCLAQREAPQPVGGPAHAGGG